jgi:hypothetical protein
MMDMGSMIAGAGEGSLGIAESIYGYVQKNKAEKAEEELLKNKPNYNIPAEVQQALNMSKAQTQGDMAGYNTAQNQISGSTATASSNISKMGLDPTMSIGALARITSSEMKARADLDTKNSIYKASMQQGYQKQLGNMADEKEKQWNWNVAGKWQDQWNVADRKRAESTAMMSQGINASLDSFKTFAGQSSSGAGSNQVADAGKQQPAQADTYNSNFNTGTSFMQQGGISPADNGQGGQQLIGNSANGSYSWGGGQ